MIFISPCLFVQDIEIHLALAIGGDAKKRILCCSAKVGTSLGQATERRSKYYIYSVETNFQDDQYSSAGRVSKVS